MVFWWLILVLTCEPATKIVSRMVLSVFNTDSSSSVSFVADLLPCSLFFPSLSSNCSGKMIASDGEAKDAPKVMKSWIAGVYDYQSSTNFDAYLKELGVGYVLRTLAALASPTITITKSIGSENKWKMKTETVFMNHEIDFVLGKEVSDKTMDGRLINMSVFQTSPNTWTETQISSQGSSKTTLVRKFSPDGMMVFLTVNNVTGKSSFVRNVEKEREMVGFDFPSQEK